MAASGRHRVRTLTKTPYATILTRFRRLGSFPAETPEVLSCGHEPFGEVRETTARFLGRFHLGVCGPGSAIWHPSLGGPISG